MDEVEVLESRGDGDAERMPIVDLIKKLTEYVASVPEEVRESAFVSLVAYGDYVTAYLHLGRDETTPERLAREQDERVRAASYKEEREARDRAEFSRLKAKYERA